MRGKGSHGSSLASSDDGARPGGKLLRKIPVGALVQPTQRDVQRTRDDPSGGTDTGGITRIKEQSVGLALLALFGGLRADGGDRGLGFGYPIGERLFHDFLLLANFVVDVN